MKGKVYKTLISLAVLLCLILTTQTPVMAALGEVDSITNYNNFLRRFQDGMTYKNTDPSTYWYREEPNRAFIYQFYKEVFDISLYNLKMDYNSKSVSTKNIEDVEEFFYGLDPGDYIYLEGYYAIFIEENNGIVTLYDVGLPILNEKQDQIHYASYEITSLCNYTASIKSYSPNSAGHKIDASQEDKGNKEFVPQWSISGITANNELYIKLGKTVRLSTYTYANGEKFDITDRMKFTSKNTSIVDIDDKKLTGVREGKTTITGTSLSLDLESPLYLTVIVTATGTKEEIPTGTQPVKWKVAGVNNKNELLLPVGAMQGLKAQDPNNPTNTKILDLISYHSSDTNIAIVKDNKVIANNPGCAFVYMSSTESNLDLPEPISVCVVNEEDMPKKEKQLTEIEILIENTKVDKIEIQTGEKLLLSLLGKYDDGTVEDLTFKFIDNVITSNSLIAGTSQSYIIAKNPGEFTLELDNEIGTKYSSNKILIKVVDPISSGYDNISGHEKSRFFDTGGHWAQKYIDILADNDIISGFEDGSFKPNEKVTLEQAVKMIVNASILIPVKEEKNIDYWVSPWAAPYVEQASPILNKEHYSSGFIGTYYATRAEIIDMVGLAINSPAKSNLNVFQDVKNIPDWAIENFETLHAKGIIEGDDFNKINPKNHITRAELSKIIAIAFNFI